MAEEVAQRLDAASQSIEGAACLVQQRIDRVRDGIERITLDGTIAQLLGIQIGGVRRQPLHFVVFGMSGQERRHFFGLVCREPIPDDRQRSSETLAEVTQRHDDLRATDGTTKMTRAQVRRAIHRGNQRRDRGDFAALTEPFEDRRMTDGSPGGSEAGAKGVTGLVPEDNQAPASASPLLMRGQSCWSQALMRASSRSLARGIGTWGLQPCWRKARLTEKG